MRTTLDIDREVLEAARAIARARNTSVGRALTELARRGLAPAEQANDQRGGFPVFKVPEGAPPITDDTVAGLLDEG